MNGITTAGYMQLAKDALVVAGGPLTLTIGELDGIVIRHQTGDMTADDQLAMAVERDIQLVTGAEDHSPTKLAQAAGRALICNALAGFNCISLANAVDAYEHMRLHA